MGYSIPLSGLILCNSIPTSRLLGNPKPIRDLPFNSIPISGVLCNSLHTSDYFGNSITISYFLGKSLPTSDPQACSYTCH